MKKIGFSENDELYIVGDIIDRGRDNGLKLLMELKEMPNVHVIAGNHEYVALMSLHYLMTTPITKDTSLSELDEEKLYDLLLWQNDGGQSTLDEFHRMSYEERLEVVDFLGELPLYAEVSCGGKEYVLVHAGLENFDEERPLDDYDPYEMLARHNTDYSRVYFPDKYLVTGHLPTRFIEENPRPDCIYRANNHIAIDCGSGLGGRLGAICLDTGEEFYV